MGSAALPQEHSGRHPSGRAGARWPVMRWASTAAGDVLSVRSIAVGDALGKHEPGGGLPGLLLWLLARRSQRSAG
jgi:hypothetical protein